MRSVIAIVLVFSLVSFAQQPGAIYDKLAKLPANAEVEVKLVSGAKVRGTLLGFDRSEVRLSGQPSPILLTEVKAVKQIHAPPVWSPLWGFAGNWKAAAIFAGVMVLVIVVVATNTR